MKWTIFFAFTLAACGPATPNCSNWRDDCRKLSGLCIDAEKTPGACQESEFCWRNWQFDCNGKKTF